MKKQFKSVLSKVWRMISGNKDDAVISFQQVKDDIKSGKCKKMYFSQITLWWSHDAADLIESTKMGKAFCMARHKAEMKNPNLSRDKRSKAEAMFKSFYYGNTPPLDFTGNPLCETDNLDKWITGAERNIEQFGRNGLKAFMRMHHKNCGGKAFASWDEVNYDIDGIPYESTTKVLAPVRPIQQVITPGRNELCPCGSGKKYKHCHAAASLKN